MPYDLYWNGDPYASKIFRKAHELHIEQRNQEMWLQGLYIYNAFGTVLANAFAKKGSKKASYLEQPIDILHSGEKEKPEMTEQEATQKIIDHFSAIKTAWENKNQGGNPNDDRKP